MNDTELDLTNHETASSPEIGEVALECGDLSPLLARCAQPASDAGVHL